MGVVKRPNRGNWQTYVWVTPSAIIWPFSWWGLSFLLRQHHAQHPLNDTIKRFTRTLFRVLELCWTFRCLWLNSHCWYGAAAVDCTFLAHLLISVIHSAQIGHQFILTACTEISGFVQEFNRGRGRRNRRWETKPPFTGQVVASIHSFCFWEPEQRQSSFAGL